MNRTKKSLPGSNAANGQESAEQSLVKLYMDLTGESEAQARGVLMFVEPESEKPKTRRPD